LERSALGDVGYSESGSNQPTGIGGQRRAGFAFHPAGYVSLLLINEAAFPGERGFRIEADSQGAMLAVLWVLHSRGSLIPAGYAQKELAWETGRKILFFSANVDLC
jgi:hypothetical protein